MKTPVDPIIQDYKRRLDVLRQLRNLLAADPSLESVLREALGASADTPINKGKTRTPRRSNKDRGTLFERTVQLFRERGNPWMTSTEIREQTGNKSRGSIGVMLYKTNEDAFERRNHPGNRKQKQWRLREAKGVKHDD